MQTPEDDDVDMKMALIELIEVGDARDQLHQQKEQQDRQQQMGEEKQEQGVEADTRKSKRK